MAPATYLVPEIPKATSSGCLTASQNFDSPRTSLVTSKSSSSTSSATSPHGNSSAGCRRLRGAGGVESPSSLSSASSFASSPVSAQVGKADRVLFFKGSSRRGRLCVTASASIVEGDDTSGKVSGCGNGAYAGGGGDDGSGSQRAVIQNRLGLRGVPHVSMYVGMRVLMVEDAAHLKRWTPAAAVATNLRSDLEVAGFQVVTAQKQGEAITLVLGNSAIHAMVVDYSMGGDTAKSREKIVDFIRRVRERRHKLPIFLLLEKEHEKTLPYEIYELVNEIVWVFDDTLDFTAGRVVARAVSYLDILVPPMLKAMFSYSNVRKELSFAAPGHQGGVAFLKSTVGRTLYDFYGENLFRSDMGIERTELGSLLDHEGPIGDSERYASRVFGSDRSYSGVVGTSGSNRTVFTACLTENEIAIIDRNCHKSIEQGLIITGAIPLYLIPSRNRYGIIGPVHPAQFTRQSIDEAVESNPLTRKAKKEGRKPVYAVVTNCTYDGMTYRADLVEECLKPIVDFIHWDEAWWAYARFNKLYENRYAMRGEPKDMDREASPTIFATQSTHKLLAALSQASFIHVRDGRRPILPGIFNESYMMHTTTSPLYAIVASNDVAVAMMDHDGPGLTRDALIEAVTFRQQLAAIATRYKSRGQWFFTPWNSEQIIDRETKSAVPFHLADKEQLISDPSCWELRPGDVWHGFDDLPEGYAMLDPIKVGIITPGMQADGQLGKWGVPAALLAAYLTASGIVVARHTEHQVLCIFSIGITRGKWSTLLSVLHKFKGDYDNNLAIEDALPEAFAANEDMYRKLGLRDLGDMMWDHMRKLNPGKLANSAFSVLPAPRMSPRKAAQMAKHASLVSLSQAANQIVATAIIPYPPGIPILMPGEAIGGQQDAYLQYLMALETWDLTFPGFEGETEGVQKDQQGRYQLYVLPDVQNLSEASAAATWAAASSASPDNLTGNGV